MRNLFTYGTLMSEAIMRRVSGLRITAEPARLQDFSRHRLHGEVYPAIVGVAGEFVDGRLYRDLTDQAWRRLDQFEDVIYCRQSVILTDPSGVEAEVYVIHPDYESCLEPAAWDYEEFLRLHQHRYLV